MVKVLEKLIAKHITVFVDQHNLLSVHQYGFRTGLSCTSQLIHLFHTWASALDNGKTTDDVFLDFVKACYSVPHKRLIHRVSQYGIQGQILHWLCDFLSNRRQQVVIDGSTSSWATVLSGVPQGSILGPLLFLLYVNEIPECIPCPSDMFADDTLLHNSAPVNEVSIPIQAGLLCMSNWCRQWLLKVCEAKCKCMRITRSKVNGQCSYSINSLPLEQVVTHKHLGVTFSSDLSWKYHVLAIAAKANRILGLLKRTFGRCSEAIITGYKTMVRPIIEYACPVWNPHQAYLSDKLERIQRNVSRWILGGPIDYTERLQCLGWMELKSRREYLSIIQLLKFINGFSRVKLDNYLSFSRASTRSRNSRKIWKPFSRTNILKFSFWHRYIDKWNSLPDSLICADSLSKFKKGLREHFLN